MFKGGEGGNPLPRSPCVYRENTCTWCVRCYWCCVRMRRYVLRGTCRQKRGRNRRRPSDWRRRGDWQRWWGSERGNPVPGSLTISLTSLQGDNPRERALDMMMGGRLEANVEEDLFKAKLLQFSYPTPSLLPSPHSHFTSLCISIFPVFVCAGPSSTRVHAEGSS